MSQNMFIRKSTDENQTKQWYLFPSDLSKYNQLVKTYENDCFWYYVHFHDFPGVRKLCKGKKCNLIPLWTFGGD